MICFKTVQRYEEKREMQSGDCKIILKRWCFVFNEQTFTSFHQRQLSLKSSMCSISGIHVPIVPTMVMTSKRQGLSNLR